MANVKRDIKFRVYLTFIGICAFALAIVLKAISIQVVEGPELRKLSKEDYTIIDTLEPERGNIYSEDGSLLSSSVPEFDVHIDFSVINKDTFKNNVVALAKGLQAIFQDKSAASYQTELTKQYNEQARYYTLKKSVKYFNYMAMRSLPILKLGANKGGFMASEKIKRTNPYGMLGNRMIGMFRTNAPSVGLESSYNNVLSGKEGRVVKQKLAGGVWMPVEGGNIDPINGKDIVTTIDVNTQDIAEQALLNVLTKEQATFGTCIVMETKTGAIKAMANLGRQNDGSYWEDANYALKPIEPGSTFKINALLSAIDDGYVTLDSKVSANGGVAYFANQKMSDSHLGLGTISVKEAFSHSSNVACAKLIYNNYTKNPQAYVNHLKKMHILDPTGIDLAGEQKPRITDRTLSFSNPASLAWMAIGYEIMVTPLRTCMVYNTIANNGVMMKPYVVKEVKEYGNTISSFSPQVVSNNVCKPTTVAALKECAFAVVEEGTGKNLKNDVYTICGKTGTAQVADKGITYKDRVYHGSFVGFFPKENPLYTVCVVIRTKKGANNYYGGQIALPVFKEVSNHLYANSVKDLPAFDKDSLAAPFNTFHKGMIAAKMNTINKKLNCFTAIPNAMYVSKATDSTGKVKLAANSIVKGTVPDVRGMGLRDAMQVLEQAGMRVSPSGAGKVKQQSINAGTLAYKGQLVNLNLE
jgi:cell division protein FtsI (penicillin-binding protein 3)